MPAASDPLGDKPTWGEICAFLIVLNPSSVGNPKFRYDYEEDGISMENPLDSYQGRVGICPTCGKNTEIWITNYVGEPSKKSLEWRCWHTTENGKPNADLVSYIYAENDEYKFWHKEGFFLVDEPIAKLSALHGMGVRKHSHGKTFDFGTWWDELLSRESVENLECLLDIPQDAPVFRAMRQAVVDELEIRRRETSTLTNPIGR